MTEESPPRLERRKVLGVMLPGLLNSYYATYRATSDSLSPSQMLLRMIQSPAPPRQGAARPAGLEEAQRRKAKQEEDALLAEIEKLHLRTLSRGIVSLEMTKEQLFDLIEDHVREASATEGGREAQASMIGPDQAMLVLPRKTVFMRLVLEPSQADDERMRQEAELRNPSESWVFSLAEHDTSVRLPPRFVREDLVVHGYYRTVSLSSVLQGAFGSFYDVVAVGKSEGAVVATLRRKPHSA